MTNTMNVKQLKKTALAMMVALSPSAFAYDLVIMNGRVMDPETGMDKVTNVAVDNGQIVEITDLTLEGDKVIDAEGLVVAPGFIDTHSHVVAIPVMQKLALRNGVTTPLALEVGAYPITNWYARLEGRSQTNFGASVSAAGIRTKVLNDKYQTRTGTMINDIFDAKETKASGVSGVALTDIATSEQIKKITEMVDKELKDGGLGIGVPVGYMSKATTMTETKEWQRLAGEYGVPTYLHGRFSSELPPTSGLLSIQEMLSSVGVYGGGLLVQHMHQQTLNETPEALKMLDDARGKGYKVMAEIYPYNYGATIAAADYLEPSNYQRNMGRDYSDIIETETMKPLTKERYEQLLKENPGASVMFYGATNDDLKNALAHESSIIGSDAFPLMKSNGMMAYSWNTPYEGLQGHPRAAGTQARVLKMVREDDLMPLMLAVSKMSYMPARFLEENGIEQMSKKGRIQVGADADITLFDPQTVADNSSLKEPGLPSTGIPYVVVNGTVVVEDSKVLEGVFPGQAIRNSLTK
ncbi:amidohydrolase family protein [Vibrio sp. SCSIO 43135]|uniref:amidohydrolase family protein n=1 Tax=Vibrio sp. SCSIO 43135 TaxID=2819096 RepID=UPI002075A720|nr:amidohydrolase family protein [Vibrio sp. SCSIO 43135]USD43334.1 amidohydrolase family protein [Vibrio sp. SCSIO 43135]